MTISETGNSGKGRAGGFTLVELLAVVAIMAIVMGVLGLSLRNMQGPSTQVAAAQVASGLSLARQIAISKNADTRFVIYGSTTGATGQGLPPESWRYWTVIVTNKNVPNPAANIWVMQKEWEKLPEGVVFLDIAAAGYATISVSPIGATVGSPFVPAIPNTQRGSTNSWRGFSSFGTFVVSSPANPSTPAFTLSSVPVVGFRGTGEAVSSSNSSRGISLSTFGQAIGVRLAEGSPVDGGRLVLRSTNNFYYVESDKFGRVRVRARESYR